MTYGFYNQIQQKSSKESSRLFLRRKDKKGENQKAFWEQASKRQFTFPHLPHIHCGNEKEVLFASREKAELLAELLFLRTFQPEKNLTYKAQRIYEERKQAWPVNPAKIFLDC